jgi:hypothetical protein
MALGGPQLGVNLMSMDLCLLLLLVGLLLVEEEFHTWLCCGGPHSEHWQGQKYWTVL